MKLSEIMNKPLAEVLEEMELVNFRPYTDDYTGDVEYIELKYKPKLKPCICPEEVLEVTETSDGRRNLFNTTQESKRHWKG